MVPYPASRTRSSVRGCRTQCGSVQKGLSIIADYLPDVYVDFRSRFPTVAAAHDGLAREIDIAGPLDTRTARLVKLGMAVASHSRGAVRSNVRKALDAGAEPAEIEHVILLALTTSGLPTVIAAWQWAQDVLADR